MSHVSRSLVVGAALAAAVTPVGVAAGASHTSAAGTPVSIRAEGLNRTLIAPTSLTTRSAKIDPDGKPADTCTGDTAAVALQDASHGHWTAGPYSSAFGYSVVGIRGESHAFTSPYYWALWINGKAASTGICGATLHAGDRVLFFPQCQLAAAKCPSGLFNPPVLALSGPKRAQLRHTVTFTVRAIANASGKPGPGSNATVRGGGKSVRANSRGQAKLAFSRAGRYVVVATAPDSVRDEMTVVVR